MSTDPLQDFRAAQPACLAHALAYAAQGWPVLPLRPGDKNPAGELVPRGFKDASTHPEVIRRWFAQVPGAGVGIHPGPAGLLVLDVDVKNGATGLQDLENLQAKYGALPPTLTQRTPSGGHHLFFSLAEPGAFGNTKLAPGIDVRCGAGYVAAEPTRTGAGAYAFEDWDILAGEVPEIAPAPAWLLELLSGGGQGAGPAPGAPGAPTAQPSREFADARTVAELRSALNALDPDDYAQWVACGQRLRGLGAQGRELWLTWSQQSAKWQPTDAQRWHGFAADHAGYRGVFAAAQSAGWINPASKSATLSGAEGPPQAMVTPARPPFSLVPVADLDTADLAPQQWVWQGLIPCRALTLLSAHGGVGKSTFALMMAVAVATGAPLFGVPTRAAPVLFYSAEDDADTVRLRLRSIIQTWGVPSALLADRLVVVDATHGAPDLVAQIWTGDGTDPASRRLVFDLTQAGASLRDLLAGAPGALLIVDNASDTFGGNENARGEVRAFVRLLVGMVKEGGGAVCLLAHIDKSSARGFGGGENYSGSTAWHNSARSRLTLAREKDGGALLLTQDKSNHGPVLRDPIRLEWLPGGLPQVEAPISGMVAAIATDNATRALLRLVHEFTQRGEFVSTAASGPACITTALRGAEGYPRRMQGGAVLEALRRAERRGWIERVAYRKDRKDRERWHVTPEGCAAAEVAPVAPVAPVPGIGATSATGNRPAPVAPVPAPGGVGGMARAREPAHGVGA